MSFAYLPWYTGDYRRDTAHLSCSEHGIFLLFLAHCWDQKGPLPFDERKLMGICNARSSDELEALRRVLAEFFIRMTDGWYNKRMTEEVARAEAKSRAYRQAGLRSAEVRRARAAVRRASAERRLNNSSTVVGIPSPNPSPNPNTNPNTRSTKPNKVKSSPSGQAAGAETALTWSAYSGAYHNRYGVLPVRNARVNAQLLAFVHRIGQEEAPLVAAFYLTHGRGLYLAAKHPTNLLLRDAEGLRTEWATGRKVTDTAARQGDRTAALGEAFAGVIAEAQAKESGKS